MYIRGKKFHFFLVAVKRLKLPKDTPRERYGTLPRKNKCDACEYIKTYLEALDFCGAYTYMRKNQEEEEETVLRQFTYTPFSLILTRRDTRRVRLMLLYCESA